MPRRRLSERQIERIERIQQRRRDRLEVRTTRLLDQFDEHSPRPGRVVVRHGANLAVADPAGEVHRCVSRQHIGDPVCGDQVVWQTTGEAVGVVTALLPRTTVLSRPDHAGRAKPLAANITLMIIVVAPRPPPTGHLIDQYLVSAESIGVEALIACTKMDLLTTAAARAGFLDGLEVYRAVGYGLLGLSIRQDPQVAALRACIGNRTAILLGQSGVGKSSLVQALLPDQAIQIGQLSQATGLGRHTTSAATCYRLDTGGYLIDSPGVRSFRLGPLDPQTLAHGFREFAPYLGHCRFADCSHRHEPDCALRTAVADGRISEQRLDTYHALVAEGGG